MSRSGFACVLAALVVTGFGGATPAADQEQKHSGIIVEVAPATRIITLEEMGPWTGPDSMPHRQIIRLATQTRIDLVSRSESAPGAGGWPGGFRTSRLEAADLRTGDFATVTAIRSGGGWVAESIAIVRPAGAIPSLRGEARESH